MCGGISSHDLTPATARRVWAKGVAIVNQHPETSPHFRNKNQPNNNMPLFKKVRRSGTPEFREFGTDSLKK